MASQIDIFHETIDALIDRLGDLPSMHPNLVKLAHQHVGFGVKAQHYALVGNVLIEAFAELLGDRFTPETRLAWETLYANTAGVMVEAAYPNERF